MSVNCINASLNAYVPSGTNTWDDKKVRHLYRRLGYGIKPSDIDQALSQSPSALVDTLVDAAVNLALTDPLPEQLNSSGPKDLDSTLLRRWQHVFVRGLYNDGLRERMAFFWSNHVVVDVPSFNQCPAYLYAYTNLLQRHALGNFKELVDEVGLTPAMLRYLNGHQNTNREPNENYARELYELFTLGEGNGYTQQDIEETARALTGYNRRPDSCAPFEFTEQFYDDGEKTIFGRTGNWGYDDVIQILFEEKRSLIAKFIVGKIYTYFVHPDLPNDTIINQLANTFETNDFEIAPVLRQLFKSQHFFDAQAMDVIIKSPTDLLLAFYKDTGINLDQSEDSISRIRLWSKQMGQWVFSPPNVAGWQRDKEWISSATMVFRWQYMDRLVRDAFQANEEDFRDFARACADESDDVVYVTKAIMDWLLPEAGLTQDDYDIALVVFKSDAVPENYYEDGTWNLYLDSVPQQVYLLLRHIVKLPEFQLK